jgi:hypothetical protein
MTGSIETVSDRERFPDIFNNYIARGDVHLRTSNGNLRIRFLGYNNGQVAFKIPYIKSMPETALVFARISEVTAYIELKSIEKQEDDVFVFSPIKVQLIHAARKEERSQPDGAHKTLLFVSNVTSDFLLFDCIRRDRKKVDLIRDKILSDLKKLFTEVKVHFVHEETGDPRMRYFFETKNQPIFIPNIAERPGPAEAERYTFYRESIYAKEQFNMKRKGLISELAVPILYKGKIPFGYLQVNNSVPINESYIQIMTRAADLASQLMIKSGIFNDMCADRLLVADISKNGIGIVFRDRKFIRYFKEKRLSVLDLTLPDGNVIQIGSLVKGITLMENKIIKVGCEIHHIDDTCRGLYESYVAAHTSHKAPEPEKKPEKKADPGDAIVT